MFITVLTWLDLADVQSKFLMFIIILTWLDLADVQIE